MLVSRCYEVPKQLFMLFKKCNNKNTNILFDEFKFFCIYILTVPETSTSYTVTLKYEQGNFKFVISILYIWFMNVITYLVLLLCGNAYNAYIYYSSHLFKLMKILLVFYWIIWKQHNISNYNFICLYFMKYFFVIVFNIIFKFNLSSFNL